LRFNLQKKPCTFYIFFFFNFNFFFLCVVKTKKGFQKKGGMSSERVLKVVGAYNLLELVGTGNFGSVYRAVNNTTGETVAIKCGCGPREYREKRPNMVSFFFLVNLVGSFEVSSRAESCAGPLRFTACGVTRRVTTHHRTNGILSGALALLA
jgi:hypothetical protein